MFIFFYVRYFTKESNKNKEISHEDVKKMLNKYLEVINKKLELLKNEQKNNTTPLELPEIQPLDLKIEPFNLKIEPLDAEKVHKTQLITTLTNLTQSLMTINKMDKSFISKYNNPIIFVKVNNVVETVNNFINKMNDSKNDVSLDKINTEIDLIVNILTNQFNDLQNFYYCNENYISSQSNQFLKTTKECIKHLKDLYTLLR